jgi:hypothetical protein
VCTNLTTGTFTCECSPGYTGNGVNCTDVDECALNQDDCNDIKGLCLNDTPGSFSCACVLPYYGDGKSCDCQQKAATNVMGQAGFDAQSSITDDGSATSFAGGFGSLVEWDSQQDADGCPDSGSVMFGSAASGVDSVPYGVSGVCAPVAPDTDYHFGFKFKLNAGAGFGCQLLEYDTSDCGTFVTAANSRHYSAPSVDDTLWRQSEDLALHTEDNVHGVLVYCQADSNQTETNYVYSHIDHFYLNSAAAKF